MKNFKTNLFLHFNNPHLFLPLFINKNPPAIHFFVHERLFISFAWSSATTAVAFLRKSFSKLRERLKPLLFIWRNLGIRGLTPFLSRDQTRITAVLDSGEWETQLRAPGRLWNWGWSRAHLFERIFEGKMCFLLVGQRWNHGQHVVVIIHEAKSALRFNKSLGREKFCSFYKVTEVRDGIKRSYVNLKPSKVCSQ